MITPISPKWREMIETRIEDERKLTVQAVGKGAKLHPGQYWDLSGTFLFTVFVMTALGFGAPVPQTAWGRTCTVVYAAFAVPGHIFFMVNISTCITFHVERIIKTRRLKRTNDIKQDVQSSSRNSDEHVFDSLTNFGLRRNISILRMFVVARGLPLTILTYYMIGAISFGYLRGLPAFETIMFPLEFTTSGGLEMVRSHVRILYAFYVEGAVFILACTIATLKFHSRNSIEDMIEKHRLFSMEPCDECEERNIKYPPSQQVK